MDPTLHFPELDTSNVTNKCSFKHLFFITNMILNNMKRYVRRYNQGIIIVLLISVHIYNVSV